NHRLHSMASCFWLFSYSFPLRILRHCRTAESTLRPGPRGMKHEDIWRALDTLAAENGLSASGLARRAGLDPTTFNPSKRRMPDGRQRWPSTESPPNALSAAGAERGART